jgi:hypothetical protein
MGESLPERKVSWKVGCESDMESHLLFPTNVILYNYASCVCLCKFYTTDIRV